jgi:hypothetical protein
MHPPREIAIVSSLAISPDGQTLVSSGDGEHQTLESAHPQREMHPQGAF